MNIKMYSDGRYSSRNLADRVIEVLDGEILPVDDESLINCRIYVQFSAYLIIS